VPSNTPINVRPKKEPWVSLLGADPRPWLLDQKEPSAGWIALTELLGVPEDAPETRRIRAALLADPGIGDLVSRLPNWEREQMVSGHNSPAFAPNLLCLLADLGVRRGDVPAVERILDQMISHQDCEGRFQSFGRWRGTPTPVWGALLCDTHAITEVLVRFGRGNNPRVRAGLARMVADLADTNQGRAWLCRREPVTGFRGPGRKDDCCPQVTIEALRTFARLPAAERPKELLEAARTMLSVWRSRADAKPYLFGHGRRFLTAKWPMFWYDVHAVLDALAGFPPLWEGSGARAEDCTAMSELAAGLIAHNFSPDGTVTPRSCFRGFEGFSFGQKKTPSAFSTSRLCALLRRLSSLAEEIPLVDLRVLEPRYKGGSRS